MKKIFEGLYSLAVALWVGGLVAIAAAATVLFTGLLDHAVAGTLANKMFAIIAYAGMAFGAYLLLYLLLRRGGRAPGSGVFWIVLAMLALTLAIHFGIQPILDQLRADALPQKVMESALRASFVKWHSVSSALYVLQSLLGLWLVVWQNHGKH